MVDWNRLLWLAAAVCALFFVAYLFRPKPELRHHNACIRNCSSSVQTIDLSVNRQGKNDTSEHKVVTVTDKAEMQEILSCLRVRNVFQTLGCVHACYGNISIRIKAGSDEYNISYDHGTGIYAIGGRDVGFVSLSSASCKKLNSLLLSKGFTKAQIGFR